MADVSTSRKLLAWKRPLVGGVLSSAVAGLTVSIFYLMPNPVSGFFGIMFLIPYYIVESFIAAFTSPSFRLHEGLGIFISILFWLIAGAMIARYFKKNKVAIGFWLLLYLLSFPISLAIFFIKNVL